MRLCDETPEIGPWNSATVFQNEEGVGCCFVLLCYLGMGEFGVIVEEGRRLFRLACIEATPVVREVLSKRANYGVTTRLCGLVPRCGCAPLFSSRLPMTCVVGRFLSFGIKPRTPLSKAAPCVLTVLVRRLNSPPPPPPFADRGVGVARVRDCSLRSIKCCLRNANGCKSSLPPTCLPSVPCGFAYPCRTASTVLAS
jgi:hypothetical protein